jgi:hypothetical protein
MENLGQELLSIKERNRKVELDKKWETSWTRRVFISALTYIIALVWLLMIHEPYAAWKAFVPTVGYFLSTLSLRFVKNFWVKQQN